MHTYRLYAGSPEDSVEAMVTHPRKVPYAERTITRWFKAALWEAGRIKRRADIPGHRKMLRWALREYAKEPGRHTIRMYRRLIRSARHPEIGVRDVFDEAVVIFCQRHGFSLIVAEVTASVGAWAKCYPRYRRFGS